MIDGVLQFDLPGPLEATSTPGAAQPLVLGSENRLLAPPLAALLGESLDQAAVRFNPLVVVGPSGSGKSHLCHGIVRQWNERLPAGAVAYFTAVDFGRQCQAARDEGRLIAWQHALRSVRLLVIEDLDRLRPRPAIHRQLRQAIDALLAAGGVLLATSRRAPAVCTPLDAGLRDRLAAGLTVRLAPPELPARRAIVATAVAARGATLSAERQQQLARHPCRAPAELLGRLAAATLDGPLESDSHVPPDALRPQLKRMLATIARYFGVTQAALAGSSRRRGLVAARNVFVHFARQYTPASYAEIGRTLGGRDHTTIMHAERRLAEWLEADPSLQAAVDELDPLMAG